MATPSTLTLAQLQALATAIPKYCPNFAFLIASQTYTTAQVMTQVNAALASASAVATAKTNVIDARAVDAKVRSESGPFLRGLIQVISTAFSDAAGTLAEFDITPKKARTPLSGAALAAAAAKAASTRAARGTKGKKQKAAITGNVTGVTITPVTAPATAPSAAPPAASATAAATTAAAVTGTNGAPPHA